MTPICQIKSVLKPFWKTYFWMILEGIFLNLSKTRKA